MLVTFLSDSRKIYEYTSFGCEEFWFICEVYLCVYVFEQHVHLRGERCLCGVGLRGLLEVLREDV